MPYLVFLNTQLLRVVFKLKQRRVKSVHTLSPHLGHADPPKGLIGMCENPEGGLDPGRVGEQVEEEEEVFPLPGVQLTVPAQVCHLVFPSQYKSFISNFPTSILRRS